MSLNTLPYEVLENILFYLPLSDKRNFILISKHLYHSGIHTILSYLVDLLILLIANQPKFWNVNLFIEGLTLSEFPHRFRKGFNIIEI